MTEQHTIHLPVIRYRDQAGNPTCAATATGERKANMSRISFQFPSHLAEQVRAHAARLDRSVGWILATSWRLAEPQIAKMVEPPKEIR